MQALLPESLSPEKLAESFKVKCRRVSAGPGNREKPGIFFLIGKNHENPGHSIQDRESFILSQNLFYLLFTSFGFMRIEQKFPLQEIFYARCESLIL